MALVDLMNRAKRLLQILIALQDRSDVLSVSSDGRRVPEVAAGRGMTNESEYTPPCPSTHGRPMV